VSDAIGTLHRLPVRDVFRHEDEAGHRVIIENQLEATDHKHLGQVLTYLSVLDADVAIWITADARAEHVSAIS